jgi:putative FmdB family regulatory protein
MPIYEYQCKQCHHCFEFLEGIGRGEKEPTCPVCRSQKVKRVFSRFAFFDSSDSWRAKSGEKSGGSAKDSKSESSAKDSKSESSAKDSKSGGSAKDSKSGGSAKDSKS